MPNPMNGRTTADGMRAWAQGGGLLTCREAAREARARGLALRPCDVEAMCAEWPGEFEHFPSVPWSDAARSGGWVWLIVGRDFLSWCEWEAARRAER